MSAIVTNAISPKIPAKPWAREWISVALIAALCISISLINPAFLQVQTLFDLARAITVPGIFALGVFVVLAAGGIDVSFTAIGACALYVTSTILLALAPDVPMPVAILLAALIGGSLGLINGALVDTFKAPSLIVTIGTQYLFRGALLAFIGSKWINDLPPAIDQFGKSSLISFKSIAGVQTSLPVSVMVLLVVSLVTWFILNKTLMGRAIFAAGGNLLITERLGFNVRRVHLFVFAYAGVLAGIGGLIHSAATRIANPFDLVGSELDVIAAVVLGGASIEGGRGSVIGVLLGTVLVMLINTNLILIGVPSTWQKVVVGTIVLIASGIFARRK